MRKPTLTAALLVSAVALLFPGVTVAATTEVTVRIEGKTETLFEGSILTDGRNVRAASDAAAPKTGHPCNGLNGAYLTPGPTPTAAAVDAMSIPSEDFDGKWFVEPFEDYFIERWGPDEQNLSNAEYWGLVVNNTYAAVGGCQYHLDQGDEVLWIYDAFNGKPRLALYPADYPGGAAPRTATATLNQPFEVEVDVWPTYNEGEPPASPTRSTTPYPGAEVAPVATNDKGFQKVDTASPKTVATGADGRASITFAEAGWHRIKATDFSAGAEIAIRSNRLDVCVVQPPTSDCGPLPADAVVRTPPPPPEDEDPKPSLPTFGEQGQAEDQAPPTTTPLPDGVKPVRLQLVRLDRGRIARGLVKASWRLLEASVGIRRWTISSRSLGRRGAGWVDRASGSNRTAATIRLPRGAAYLLRLTVTDALGRSSSAALGKVRVPR